MSDLISREEAIKAVKFYETFYDPYPRVIEALEKLPLVQLKLANNSPKLDKEIGECNDCIKHGGDWECDRVHCHKGDAISRQAAIDALDVLCQEHRYKIPGKGETYSQYNEAWQDALDRAEGAIGNLPSAQPEPCKDAVSREAVSEWLKQYGQDVLHGKYKFSLMYIWKNLMALPSSQPRKGKWIYGEHESAMCDGYRCDKCGFFVPWDYQHKFIDFIKDYNYCPSCGADMRGEQDESIITT